MLIFDFIMFSRRSNAKSCVLFVLSLLFLFSFLVDLK